MPDQKNMKILLIGSLPPRIGGATVNLELLIDELSVYEDIDIDVVNTSPRFGGPIGEIDRLMGSPWQAIFKLKKADVVTAHLSRPAIALLFYFMTCFWRKPFVIRWYGGANYREFGGALRPRIVRWLLKHADMTLFETKELVRLATEDGAKRAVWYSNSRTMPDNKELGYNRRRFCRRFVYIGHIRPYKGIREMIEASEKLSSICTLDVYGPFYDGLSERIFDNCKNLKYRGILSPQEVIPVMKSYDALVMPTKMPTEGYPGAIVEAFAAGIPIISTKCGAIPEIVDDTCGILVEPKDAKALYGAMKALVEDDTLYTHLCEGTRSKRDAFSSKFWADKFIEYCRQVNMH